MTRAAFALLRGDFAHAIALHPLSPFVLPLATAVMVSEVAAFVRTGSALGVARLPRSIELVAAATAALLVGVWISRFFGCFGGPVSVG
jgi:hypothetical protein